MWAIYILLILVLWSRRIEIPLLDGFMEIKVSKSSFKYKTLKATPLEYFEIKVYGKNERIVEKRAKSFLH